MQVIIISECTKRALTESRRILDQFAERRGERTWQTSITWEGLKTLRRLLRRTARRNTAIACHWVRGVNQTELLWTVGKSRHFNERGTVPTNTTGKEILRLSDENDWHTGEIIYLLSSFAALLHDLGKACDAFQMRLKNKSHHPGGNAYRHEWVSLRLFQAFVGQNSDKEWLEHIVETGGGEPLDWLTGLEKDGLLEQCSAPFKKLPTLAAAIGWLVLSHHRLPDTFAKGKIPTEGDVLQYFLTINAKSNQFIAQELTKKQIRPYWSFSEGLPVVNKDWQKRARRLARRLLVVLDKQSMSDLLGNLYVMHLSRLSLMLADHHYSSLSDKKERIVCQSETALYANTKSGQMNQTLEEHLVGVALNAGYVTHGLPSLEYSLPTLANHRGLRKRTQIARFRWQDKAFDLVTSIRDEANVRGAFFVNMASTGCGKTLANARIMYALAQPEQGARFTVALGLRTLTLQTGQAYKAQRMFLDDDQLAVRVGGAASKALFEFYRQKAEETGSESIQDLMDEDGGVLYEGEYDTNPLLRRTLHSRQVKSLISAPVLVCTVDHLTPATEGVRGGRQIAPMLRLMTSDLVLDEIDDFGLDDLPALARLVHWAGVLGARVMLSSATLPPALVQGLFSAYLAGRQQYQHNRGSLETAIDICTAWFDEHECTYADCATVEVFTQRHQQFVEGRTQRLENKIKEKDYQRLGAVVPIQIAVTEKKDFYTYFAQHLIKNALQLHADNAVQDPKSGKQVSFGLIRMANIEPLVRTALAIFKAGLEEDYRIHLCVYHSQYPLIMRSAIERELDSSLNRSDVNAVFNLPTIQTKLNTHKEKNQLFVVLGSPVTEVGRDHDYDWAIIEPSSMRSIIQLVGRVRRHRPKPWDKVNVHILSRNVRSWRAPGKPAFQRPGFESSAVKLKSHDVMQLLKEDEWLHIDSRPRIQAHKILKQNESLIDIEHYQLERIMLPQIARRPPRRRRVLNSNEVVSYRFGPCSWWTAHNATLMTLLQKHYPFRSETQKQLDFVLLVDDEENDYKFCRIDSTAKNKSVYIPIEESLLKRVADNTLASKQISAWFQRNYMDLVMEQAEAEGISASHCSKRYGLVTLGDRAQGWYFHPFLGFYSGIPKGV